MFDITIIIIFRAMTSLFIYVIIFLKCFSSHSFKATTLILCTNLKSEAIFKKLIFLIWSLNGITCCAHAHSSKNLKIIVEGLDSQSTCIVLCLRAIQNFRSFGACAASFWGILCEFGTNFKSR